MLELLKVRVDLLKQLQGQYNACTLPDQATASINSPLPDQQQHARYRQQASISHHQL